MPYSTGAKPVVEHAMPRLLLGAAALAATLPAHAGFDTGNRLFEDCSAENYFNRGYCGGYVTGIVDMLEALSARGVIPKNTLCIPEGVTKGQLADVVKKYLGEHPERRHLDAGGLVPEALTASFPCKR
jgi:hypothetical protein